VREDSAGVPHVLGANKRLLCAAANKRLRVLEAEKRETGATRSDVNRLESQVLGFTKQLTAASAKVEAAARAEFEAKAGEVRQRYAAELETLRKEIHGRAFAEIRGFNPVGEWKAGMTLNRMDVVSLAGSSFLVLADGVKEKPKVKSDKFQVLARRGAGGGSGGVIIETNFTNPPAGASSAGSVGQYSYDESYYYLCVAVNTWLRTSLATW